MTRLAAIWRLSLARLRANWRLQTTVALGALVAVVLLASAPLYSAVLNDLGLRYTLRREPPARSDVQVQISGRAARPAEYQSARAAVEGAVSGAIGSVVAPPIRFGRSGSYFIYRPDQPVRGPGQTPNNQPRGNLQFADSLGEHVRITEGSWPATGSGDVPAIAGREGAGELGLKVGDSLLLAPAAGGQPLRIRIAAIGEAGDLNDRYWAIGAVRAVERARDWTILPLFLDESQLFQVAGESTVDFAWYWSVDTTRLTTINAGQTAIALGRLRATLGGTVPGAAVVTALDAILNDYLAKLALTEIPLYLLIAQIVGLVLFYLVLAGGVVVEQQAAEIALLKSRGASGSQVLALFFTEGAIMCLLAVLIGPIVAVALVNGLIRLPGSALARQPVEVSLTVDTWLLAVLGGLLALGALVVPAARAAGTSIVLYRRQAARSGGPPIWQRYYLDIVLLMFAAFGYWEITHQATTAGVEEIDPLLLLSPAILALGVSAAFLRLFPLLLRLLTGLLGGLASPPILLGLLHLSRRPSAATRVVLLLTLTTTLGLFAATFSATIDQSYYDRTAYRVGADLRIEAIAGGAGRPIALLDGTIRQYPAVQASAGAYRERGAVGPPQANRQYTFLAVDSVAGPDVIWFREDFAGQTLGSLLSSLADEGTITEGPIVPPGGETIGVWVRSTPPQPRLNVFVRLVDADGKILDLELGRLDFADWRLLEAPLSGLGDARGPLRLTGLYLQQAPGSVSEPGGGSVQFDDLGIRERGGIRRIVESFDTIGAWEVLRDGAGEQSDRIELVRETRSGTPGARFGWSPRRTFGTRGLRLRGEESALPVLASSGFLAASGRSVGDTLFVAVGDRTIQATIRGTIELFPTLDPAGAGFVLAPLAPALSHLNAVPGRPIYPNEVWARLRSAEPIEALRQSAFADLGARSVLVAADLRQGASSDPLVAAGWTGILALAFLTALLLSLVGFVVQGYFSLQRRIVEFAILRTMGLSFRQLTGLIAFEHLLVVVIGIGIGSILGLQLGSILLPFLELTERGGRVLPPFVVTTDWRTVLPAYGFLALFFLSAVGTMATLVTRLPIGRTLRIGD